MNRRVWSAVCLGGCATPPVANLPPEVVFVAAEVAVQQQPWRIDASASHDPEGAPVEVSFRMTSSPPGSQAVLLASGPTATLSPDQLGAYQVEVEVWDGTWSTTERTEVTVVDNPVVGGLDVLDPARAFALGRVSLIATDQSTPLIGTLPDVLSDAWIRSDGSLVYREPFGLWAFVCDGECVVTDKSVDAYESPEHNDIALDHPCEGSAIDFRPSPDDSPDWVLCANDGVIAGWQSWDGRDVDSSNLLYLGLDGSRLVGTRGGFADTIVSADGTQTVLDAEVPILTARAVDDGFWAAAWNADLGALERWHITRDGTVALRAQYIIEFRPTDVAILPSGDMWAVRSGWVYALPVGGLVDQFEVHQLGLREAYRLATGG